MKAKIKFPKIKKVKKSTVKAKANKYFSIYIRLSNMELPGTVECYTCPARMFWKAMQAGHGIPGRNNAVLYMEKLVKPQCVQCNIFKHGNLAVFTRKLIAELGVKEYDRLAEEAKQTVQYKVYQYQEIADTYKKKIEELGFTL